MAPLTPASGCLSNYSCAAPAGAVWDAHLQSRVHGFLSSRTPSSLTSHVQHQQGPRGMRPPLLGGPPLYPAPMAMQLPSPLPYGLPVGPQPPFPPRVRWKRVPTAFKHKAVMWLVACKLVRRQPARTPCMTLGIANLAGRRSRGGIWAPSRDGGGQGRPAHGHAAGAGGAARVSAAGVRTAALRAAAAICRAAAAAGPAAPIAYCRTAAAARPAAAAAATVLSTAAAAATATATGGCSQMLCS